MSVKACWGDKLDLAFKLQHNLDKKLYMVDELLKVWLGRSVYYGREIYHMSYSRSILII